jgi:hypothetical protein
MTKAVDVQKRVPELWQFKETVVSGQRFFGYTKIRKQDQIG